MCYNFWSILYFYMKFLEDTYCSIDYLYSEVQYWHAPFVFFITFCSYCSMEWDALWRATDDLCWAFLSPGTQEPLASHKQYCFRLGSWKKKNSLGINPKKIIILAPFHRKAFVPLYTFKMSQLLLGGPSNVFFAITEASNLRFSWRCSGLSLLTVVRATLLSFLFCI